MPYCCTWLIVAACWLLQAPSLGTLSSQHLRTFGCPLPGSRRLLLPKRHFFSPQMWESLCPFSLLLSKCWLAGAVMSTGLPTLVVNTRPLTVHSLWAPFLPCPSLSSSASPSSSSLSLPLTLPLTAFLSFVWSMWDRDFGISFFKKNSCCTLISCLLHFLNVGSQQFGPNPTTTWRLKI